MAKSRKIVQISNGQRIKEFNSIKEAATELGLQRSSICEVLKKNRRYKSTGGFQFEYVDEILPNEIWKMHHLGRLVSNLGRVQDLNGLRSFGVKTRLGYRRVQIDTRKIFVHRLVIEAFVGPCPQGLECDHIDRNRENNRVENLRWVTHLENIRNK